MIALFTLLLPIIPIAILMVMIATTSHRGTGEVGLFGVLGLFALGWVAFTIYFLTSPSVPHVSAEVSASPRTREIPPDSPEPDGKASAANKRAAADNTYPAPSTTNGAVRLMPTADPNRPPWIEYLTKWNGGRNWSAEPPQSVVATSANNTRSQTEWELDQELEAETRLFVNYILNQNGYQPADLGFDETYIRQHLLDGNREAEESPTFQNPWIDENAGDSTGEPLSRAYALLTFDQDFQREILERYRAQVIPRRIGLLSLIAGGLLLAIGVVYGYLRIDTATRGYYTRRLQVAAVALILIGIACGYVVAMWTGIVRG